MRIFGLTTFMCAALLPWAGHGLAHEIADETLDILGSQMVIKVHGVAATIIEETTPPGGGPPLHVDYREDELLYILEGIYRVWRGDTVIDMGPGVAYAIPKGVRHTFKNVSDIAGRILVTLVPGGLEGFFEQVAARGLTLPDDQAAVAALAREYGLDILGPPPNTAP